MSVASVNGGELSDDEAAAAAEDHTGNDAGGGERGAQDTSIGEVVSAEVNGISTLSWPTKDCQRSAV